jgi:DNA-directed RNA polymerase subunit RPC12/RpoP
MNEYSCEQCGEEITEREWKDGGLCEECNRENDREYHEADGHDRSLDK